MESAVTAPVSGHVKRVVVHEGMRWLYSNVFGFIHCFHQQVIPSIKVTLSSRLFISYSLEEHLNLYSLPTRFTFCLLIRFAKRMKYLEVSDRHMLV